MSVATLDTPIIDEAMEQTPIVRVKCARPVRKYRVLVGTHVQDYVTDGCKLQQDCTLTDGTPHKKFIEAVITKDGIRIGGPHAPEEKLPPGGWFESDQDLTGRMNGANMSPKFQLLDEGAAVHTRVVKVRPSVLAKMSVQELMEHAADNEIDLGGAKGKDEIIAVLTR